MRREYVRTVFELSPRQEGGWTETVLHNFSGSNDGGNLPLSGSLTFDAAGNLYGTTNEGGITSATGTVFELSPNEGGGWTADRWCTLRQWHDGNVPHTPA